MTPKFAKIEPDDVPDLPGTVPGKLLGFREDVPVEGWYWEVRNPELSADPAWRRCVLLPHVHVVA
jgi:hypothetical protein